MHSLRTTKGKGRSSLTDQKLGMQKIPGSTPASPNKGSQLEGDVNDDLSLRVWRHRQGEVKDDSPWPGRATINMGRQYGSSWIKGLIQ